MKRTTELRSIALVLAISSVLLAACIAAASACVAWSLIQIAAMFMAGTVGG